MRTPLRKSPKIFWDSSPAGFVHAKKFEGWWANCHWVRPAHSGRLPFSSAMRWRENDRNLILDTRLPGFQSEDIRVQVDGHVLHVQAEKKSQEKPRDFSSVGSPYFSESVRLPSTVDPHEARAELKNDFLTVTLPKTPQNRTRSIPVAVSPRSGWARWAKQLIRMTAHGMRVIREIVRTR